MWAALALPARVHVTRSDRMQIVCTACGATRRARTAMWPECMCIQVTLQHQGPCPTPWHPLARCSRARRDGQAVGGAKTCEARRACRGRPTRAARAQTQTRPSRSRARRTGWRPRSSSSRATGGRPTSGRWPAPSSRWPPASRPGANSTARRAAACPGIFGLPGRAPELLRTLLC